MSHKMHNYLTQVIFATIGIFTALLLSALLDLPKTASYFLLIACVSTAIGLYYLTKRKGKYHEYIQKN